jgi:hypothetical protein
VLEGQAVFAGTVEPVSIRVADAGGRIYLDLGDESWKAIEIDAAGWRLVDDVPVKMRRPAGMAALPVPVPGGTVNELRAFLNVATDEDWVLTVAWLIAALRPTGPYPVLGLHGEHGTSKSTVARVAKALIDPNAAPLRADPREQRDLMIGASNGHVLAFDNLSRLPQWLSDALCRIATGGGFAVRELYSDDNEIIFEAMRPTIVTGIAEVAVRGDLVDRSLIVTLPTISESERRAEKEFWDDFDHARPRILGALLDAVVAASRELPTVELDELPRMADFAIWATAAERGLGWTPGTFKRAYDDNRESAVDMSLEASVLTDPIKSLGAFAGTASDLLERLGEIAGDDITKRKSWPTTASTVSSQLRRVAPNLRDIDIEVEFHREGRRRLIRITPQTPSQPSQPSQTALESGSEVTASGRPALSRASSPSQAPLPAIPGLERR